MLRIINSHANCSFWVKMNTTNWETEQNLQRNLPQMWCIIMFIHKFHWEWMDFGKDECECNRFASDALSQSSCTLQTIIVSKVNHKTFVSDRHQNKKNENDLLWLTMCDGFSLFVPWMANHWWKFRFFDFGAEVEWLTNRAFSLFGSYGPLAVSGYWKRRLNYSSENIRRKQMILSCTKWSKNIAPVKVEKPSARSCEIQSKPNPELFDNRSGVNAFGKLWVRCVQFITLLEIIYHWVYVARLKLMR